MAYGAISGQVGHIGGVERQTSLMARWLAGHGWRVSLVTWREGLADDEMIDGVHVIKLCTARAGWPGVRFFHPRWTSLTAALRLADADVYYHNSAEYVTGQVALWCRRHSRRFVYSVASDPACDARLPTLKRLRERMLYRYGLRRADRLIVQTRTQHDMLREGFGLDSVVLPMPCRGPDDAEFEPPVPPAPDRLRVVWVGRIAWMKRLELLLDAAEAIPQVQFDVAGRPDPEDDYTRALRVRAEALPNVRMLGAVPWEDVGTIYEGALCLCCTSIFEGFPNTFLEAWARGVPVVSTFDPDGLITRRQLGASVDTRDGLVQAIQGLTDARVWARCSEQARAYFTGYHATHVAMSRFERVLSEVASDHIDGLRRNPARTSLARSLLMLAPPGFSIETLAAALT
jgi:glycosyltransferase involved in cell wall biosynthesis